MQEVNLAAAFEFTQYRFANEAVADRGDESLDGQTALRGSGDDRKIAQTFQRHCQRARNRRSRQCQHVHFRAQRLELLLLAHAEAVLLVDDGQPKVLELYATRKQLVRADGNVDFTFRQAFQRGGCVLGRAETRKLRNLDRPVGKTVREGLEMLFSEQGRRHQNRHLFAICHCNECGTQGDLGLAKTDISAYQTIHRPATLHVANHGLDGGCLVRGFLEGKALAEGFVIV